MPYPKERIARENEKSLMAWLRNNDKKLPLSLYQLSKELNWTFGATRGTILRLIDKPENQILKLDIIDEKTKRFKTKIALLGRPSETRLRKEVEKSKIISLQNPKKEKLKHKIPENTIILKLDMKKKIIRILNRLLEIDSKVVPLATKLPDKYIQAFLDANFGLTNEEKMIVNEILEALKKNDYSKSSIEEELDRELMGEI